MRLVNHEPPVLLVPAVGILVGNSLHLERVQALMVCMVFQFHNSFSVLALQFLCLCILGTILVFHTWILQFGPRSTCLWCICRLDLVCRLVSGLKIDTLVCVIVKI